MAQYITLSKIISSSEKDLIDSLKRDASDKEIATRFTHYKIVSLPFYGYEEHHLVLNAIDFASDAGNNKWVERFKKFNVKEFIRGPEIYL